MLPYITVESIRQTYIAKSRRRRQCFECCKIIKKDDYYINHQFRYDSKIVTISMHPDCCDELVMTGRKF